MGLFSNIMHKPAVRTQMLESVAGGLKEANRKRQTNQITADGSDHNVFVAPWSGYVEELYIASPAATTSTSSNSVTVTVDNITQSTTLVSFDTFVNGVELLANKGIKVDFNFGISGGRVLSQYNAGDLIAISVTINGTLSGLSSSSVFSINTAFTPNDKKVTI